MFSKHFHLLEYVKSNPFIKFKTFISIYFIYKTNLFFSLFSFNIVLPF